MWRRCELARQLGSRGLGVRQDNEFVIVSADSDFYELATTIGPPLKVGWRRHWTHPTEDAERLLRREAIRIREFAADPELGVLVLDRD